ncbi:MAG TPA: hypothetical protein VL975_01165 [Candidatus Micrarchaeia archaeon]|nr:hypothetical protein [Candidatus Micrarchaeia archaeon]
MNIKRLELWFKGLVAAGISGAAGGVLTGFAAVGIDPHHFNFQTGIGSTFRIALAASLINAIIGVAAYLQKSPLPDESRERRMEEE